MSASTSLSLRKFIITVPGLIGMGLMILFGYLVDFKAVEVLFSDMRYRFWAPPPLLASDPKSFVSLITIDNETIRELNGWPITPNQHKNFLKKLLRPPSKECEMPKAIGFDIIFEDFHTKKFYEEIEIESLAALLLRSREKGVPVVVSYLLRDKNRLVSEGQKIGITEGLPSDKILQALTKKGTGYTNVLEIDKKTRKLFLRFANKAEKKEDLSFTAALLESVAPKEDPKWKKKVSTLPKEWKKTWNGEEAFPLSPSLKPTEVFYPESSPLPLPNVSYLAILKGLTPELYQKYISNKILIICPASLDLGDVTQLLTQSGQETVPGGTVHGVALQTWLEVLTSSLKPPPLPQEISILFTTLILGLCGILTGLINHTWRAILTGFLILSFYLSFSWWTAKPEINFQFPLILPFFAFIFALLPGIAYGRAREERIRRRAISQMKGLTAPEVVERLMEDTNFDPFRLERTSLTCMIGDLRGFTEFSENCTPEQLGQALQHLLDPLIQVAVAHKGTVWQIAGDEIKVFFNAPTKIEEDHRLIAVEAAAEMLDVHRKNRLACMASDWWPTYKEGKKIQAPYFGFGIASGDVVVGFIGSRLFSYYTGYGMAINIASRLCGKATAESVLVTNEIKDAVPANFLEEADAFELKGVSGKTQTYRLRSSAKTTRRFLKNFNPSSARTKTQIYKLNTAAITTRRFLKEYLKDS